jgi:NADH-quinone oxidoreductase subunit G
MAVKLPIEVDGEMIDANAGQNLLETCIAAGRDIPYFCWHPALGSVGACRQCAVKIFRTPADPGQIAMACMTPVAPGMRVSIEDAAARGFRESVVEDILTNHPHDCPVCEVGGECHLQDMTVMTGHHARRYGYPKRTHVNQDLGPLIKHEMNRCIGCYRCLRFYRDYAGGKDFGVFGANRNIYFGRATDGTLQSEFAGNLVEVCPTGVFVDKPFSAKFRRQWDMRSAASICPHCAVGCNITIQERDGQYRRTRNRYNETLNGHFICDRGRFGPGFLNAPQRLRETPDTARGRLAEVLRGGPVIGIGSPRASIESNFALRQIVGPGNFCASLDESAAIDIMKAVPIATLRDAEQADAVVILGGDPAEVAPRLALSLRTAAVRPSLAMLAAREIPAWHDAAARGASPGPQIPFVITTASPSWLDEVATQTYRAAPDDITELAIAMAAEIPAFLLGSKSPVIVAGGGIANLRAAANIVIALRRRDISARLVILLAEANTAGLALMDPGPLPDMRGCRVVVLEADVALPAGACTAVLDHIETAATRSADFAIAVASFAESDGTFVNLEGRAQRFLKAIAGADDPPPAWEVLRDAAIAAGRLPRDAWATHAAILTAMGEAIPALGACATAPSAFLFSPPQDVPFFEIPPKPWAARMPDGPEPLSALSPALIARGARP